MGVRRPRLNGHLPHLETGTKNQTFLEDLKLAVKFRLIDLIVAHDSLFASMTLTLHKN